MTYDTIIKYNKKTINYIKETNNERITGWYEQISYRNNWVLP